MTSRGGQIAESAMTKYLAEHSLEKLTGDLAETTKQRLRSAIADAVESGGNADQIVSAINDTMADFSTTRAELIAQTEVNGAYSWARNELADGAGMTEKSWVTESGEPCDECIANEDQEWIDITDKFQSGHMPRGTPWLLLRMRLSNCDCWRRSLEMGTIAPPLHRKSLFHQWKALGWVTPPRREWVYVQRPSAYEISGCPTCGNVDPDWSEFRGYLWCQICHRDFRPEFDGVFGGPIPVNSAALMGIDLRRRSLADDSVV